MEAAALVTHSSFKTLIPEARPVLQKPVQFCAGCSPLSVPIFIPFLWFEKPFRMSLAFQNVFRGTK